MSIISVKDKKSIVPFRDEKRFITLPSGKIKDINVVSVNVLTPRSTRDYSNISKTIEELNRQILLQDKKIKDIDLELSGNTLKQRLEHTNIILKGYTIYCFIVLGDIQILRCSNLRKQNKCRRECSPLKDFIKKIS